MIFNVRKPQYFISHTKSERRHRQSCEKVNLHYKLACVAGGIVWLKFWRRGRDPKKGVGTRRLKFLAASPLVAALPPDSHSTGTAAPPPNLTRLVHNTASYAG